MSETGAPAPARAAGRHGRHAAARLAGDRLHRAGEELLAALDARDRLVEVADDRAHRVEQVVLQAQQLVALRARVLDPAARLGADPHRRLLGLRDDLAGAGVRALLDLGGATKHGGHRLRELVLLPAEVLDLVARGLELALEVAVSVAQRLEIVVELAERQAQLRERELDILATVAAAEALVAQGWPLISVRSAH